MFVLCCVVLFPLLQSGTRVLLRAVGRSQIEFVGWDSRVFLGGGFLVVLDRELTRLSSQA